MPYTLPPAFYFRAVYSSVQLAKQYFPFYLKAANSKGHGMHSPFVFDFIEHVLNNKSAYTPTPAMEALRRQLFQNPMPLPVLDLGAGSRVASPAQKTVRQIARTAVKSKKWSLLLYRLACHYKPQTMVELGTSLGISTAYLAAANAGATVYTIEGSPAIRAQAQQSFQQLGMGNIKSLEGPFDSVLPLLLQQLPVVDLAYLDGNHRRAPTLAYFQQLLQHKNEYSIFVFDDIHWSAEMEEAWAVIKQHPEVRCTIDLFFLGLVFFRTGFKSRRHFSIRF